MKRPFYTSFFVFSATMALYLTSGNLFAAPTPPPTCQLEATQATVGCKNKDGSLVVPFTFTWNTTDPRVARVYVQGDACATQEVSTDVSTGVSGPIKYDVHYDKMPPSCKVYLDVTGTGGSTKCEALVFPVWATFFPAPMCPSSTTELSPSPKVTVSPLRGPAVELAPHYVAKMTPSSCEPAMTTVAGNEEITFSGDDTLATHASLDHPIGVTVDAAGNLYIADTYNNRIRKVDTGQIIHTVAKLDSPYAVAVDDSGNIYIADTYNNEIRKVDASGEITTVAGNGTPGFSGDDGPAIAAQLNHPSGVVVNAGNLYIADAWNHRIRKIDTSGTMTTVAGNEEPSSLKLPTGVAVDAVGNLYIADQYDHKIRRVDTKGVINTVAGTGTEGLSGDGGPATAATLNNPFAVAVDNAGNLYIADSGNNLIRKIDWDASTSSFGNIHTVAGNGKPGFSGDGPATDKSLSSPNGVTVDGAGNLYIADSGNSRIRKVASCKTAPADERPLPPVFHSPLFNKRDISIR